MVELFVVHRNYILNSFSDTIAKLKLLRRLGKYRVNGRLNRPGWKSHFKDWKPSASHPLLLLPPLSGRHALSARRQGLLNPWEIARAKYHKPVTSNQMSTGISLVPGCCLLGNHGSIEPFLKGTLYYSDPLFRLWWWWKHSGSDWWNEPA